MLDLLRHRLLATGPQPPDGREYVAGIDDAIAAVSRLIDNGTARDPVSTSWSHGDPDPTRLAHEYLTLELTSLLRMVNATLRPLNHSPTADNGARTSLSEARQHMIRARAALAQVRGREPA